jgi:hypothetical protein
VAWCAVCFHQAATARFRISKLTLDHSEWMLNLCPDLCFRIFDFAPQAPNQTLFGVFFIAAGPCGNRLDYLAILILRTLVHAGVTGIARHV